MVFVYVFPTHDTRYDYLLVCNCGCGRMSLSDCRGGDEAAGEYPGEIVAALRLARDSAHHEHCVSVLLNRDLNQDSEATVVCVPHGRSQASRSADHACVLSWSSDITTSDVSQTDREDSND